MYYYIQTRWAWANEVPSQLEQYVAPRVVHKHWFLLTGILILSSWFLICITVILTIFIPLSIGRTLQHLIQLPDKFKHDPFCYAVGFFTCWFIGTSIQQMNSTMMTKYMKIIMSIPNKVVYQGDIMLDI
jgi:hypothetical protein